MIEVEGRKILSALEEKVDPAHAAVVVIDMQKDFTSSGGFADSLGLDMRPMDVARSVGSSPSSTRLVPMACSLFT